MSKEAAAIPSGATAAATAAAASSVDAQLVLDAVFIREVRTRFLVTELQRKGAALDERADKLKAWIEEESFHGDFCDCIRNPRRVNPKSIKALETLKPVVTCLRGKALVVLTLGDLSQDNVKVSFK